MNQFNKDLDPYGLYSADDAPVLHNLDCPTHPDVKEEITQMDFRRKRIPRMVTHMSHHSISSLRKLSVSVSGSGAHDNMPKTSQEELPGGNYMPGIYQDERMDALIEGVRIGVGTHEYSIRSIGTSVSNGWVRYSDCSKCLDLIYEFHGRMEDELGIPFNHIADIPKLCPPSHPDWLQTWQDHKGTPSSQGFLQLERLGLTPKLIEDKTAKEASLAIRPTSTADQHNSCKICALLSGFKPRNSKGKLILDSPPLSSAATVDKVKRWLRSSSESPSPPPVVKSFTSQPETHLKTNTKVTPQVSYIQSAQLKKVLLQKSAMPHPSLTTKGKPPRRIVAALSRHITCKSSDQLQPSIERDDPAGHISTARRTRKEGAFITTIETLGQSSQHVSPQVTSLPRTKEANTSDSALTAMDPLKAHQLINSSSAGSENLGSLIQSPLVCSESHCERKRERMVDNCTLPAIAELETEPCSDTQMLCSNSEPTRKKPCFRKDHVPWIPTVVKDEQSLGTCSLEVDWRFENLHDNVRDDLERGKSIEFALAYTIPYEID